MKVLVIEDTVADGRDIFAGDIEEIPDDIVHRFVNRGQVTPLDPEAEERILEATLAETERATGLASPARQAHEPKEEPSPKGKPSIKSKGENT